MSDWAELLTEQRNDNSVRIDEVSTLEMLRIINNEDVIVATAVSEVLESVAEAVEAAAKALTSDGRLFYVGAGSSGRLGVLDAAECPPTFSTNPDMVQAIIAGGQQAVFASIEGSEDSAESGNEIDWILSRGDVTVLKYEIVDYNVDGVYPSDHKPVLVEYQIR